MRNAGLLAIALLCPLLCAPASLRAEEPTGSKTKTRAKAPEAVNESPKPTRVADPVEALIRLAGNADDDAVRLAHLKKLQARPDLHPQLRAELGQLVGQVERWCAGKFPRSLRVRKDSPLYPIACLYRARALVARVLESGGARSLTRARELLEVTKRAFPENRIVRMYLGEPIPSNKKYPGIPEAPEWASLQREGLERLADIVEWWIDNRMQENGEFGGGWGDDCEMWRWWVPVLIAFDDPKITKAQTRFSNALLKQPHMKLGYTTRMSDVEHTAEDSGDTITPMMHLEPDNKLWTARALRLVELAETLWMGRNQRGFLQFKSTYFSARRIDTRPVRACDTVYHPRALQPALVYWQRTGDPRVGKLVTAWMDTWVDATARTERGKPAGIIPSAIHWPDGRIGGVGGNWWDPRNARESSLYRWPSAMGMVTNSLLLAHHLTDDPKYLQPIRSMAKIRLDYLACPPEERPAKGTEAWCASRLGCISGTFAKYRFLTGKTDFDELLAKEASPYVAYRLRGDKSALVSALRRNALALRINFEGYTSEVRYTDRVLRFPWLFSARVMFEKPIPSIRRPDTLLLYSTATGDPGGVVYFPLNAVRWLTPPREIAALVTETGPDRFEAKLFHFGRRDRAMAAELYLLKPGRYGFALLQDGSARQPSAADREFTVTGRRSRISFSLPAGKLCTLRVRRLAEDRMLRKAFGAKEIGQFGK